MSKHTKGLHMRSAIASGIVAGLIAGIVMGIAMHLQSMMTMVAQVVGSDSLAIGWLYHLFNSAVIGAIFGLLLGRGTLSYRAGLLRGSLYGFAWSRLIHQWLQRGGGTPLVWR